jgi:hypothetical protein
MRGLTITDAAASSSSRTTAMRTHTQPITWAAAESKVKDLSMVYTWLVVLRGLLTSDTHGVSSQEAMLLLFERAHIMCSVKLQSCSSWHASTTVVIQYTSCSSNQ